MLGQLVYQLLISISFVAASDNEVQLPLCPRHLEYFPQELPMHCRMTRNIDSQSFPGMVDIPEFQTSSPDTQQYPYYRNPPPDKQAPPIPIPIPSGGMPGMPPGMGLSMPGAMQGMPGSMSMPMPMPLPMLRGPSHKLPVIVMPFYSPDVSHHRHSHHGKRHPHHENKRQNSTELFTDSEERASNSESDKSDSSDSGEGWWKGHKKKKNHKKYGISRRSNGHHIIKKIKKTSDLLTPILQYVTKDGYVIFEKKISKNEAKDWLGPKDEDKAKEEEVAILKDAEFLEELEVKTPPEETKKYDTAKTKRKDISKEVNELVDPPQKEQKFKKQKHFKQKIGTLLKP